MESALYSIFLEILNVVISLVVLLKNGYRGYMNLQRFLSWSLLIFFCFQG